jgi:hypothetical protein
MENSAFVVEKVTTFRTAMTPENVNTALTNPTRWPPLRTINTCIKQVKVFIMRNFCYLSFHSRTTPQAYVYPCNETCSMDFATSELPYKSSCFSYRVLNS